LRFDRFYNEAKLLGNIFHVRFLLKRCGRDHLRGNGGAVFQVSCIDWL
jgi:hypothetical protein